MHTIGSDVGTALRSEPASAAARRTAWLAAAVAAAAALALVVGDPQPLLQADPDLAWLLRGMAAIKGLLVAAAVVAIAWRLRRPAPPALAAAYVAGVAGLAAATASIWQLSHIVPAALLFHAAEIALLVLAWRDGAVLPRRPAPRPRLPQP